MFGHTTTQYEKVSEREREIDETSEYQSK